MKSTHSLLLATTALIAVTSFAPQLSAAPLERNLILAQAAVAPAANDADERKARRARTEDRKDKVKDVKSAEDAKKAPRLSDEMKPGAVKRTQKDEPDRLHMNPPVNAPAAATAPAMKTLPTAQKPADKAPAPAAQIKPASPATAAQPSLAPAPHTAAQPSMAKPAAQNAQPTAEAAPPAKARDAGEFIRRAGQQQGRGMADIRKERHEVREGNRTVIREGDRTIVREGNRTIIRHDESDRFAVGARNVQVEHRGNETLNIVLLANGVRIVSTVDSDGHLIRRSRRDRDGRELVIIDNGFAGARRGDYFVDLPPPVIRIPRDRYIVDAGHASAVLIYGAFTAQPVQTIDRRYTVDQVRYSYPLRERMPRVDLDINFDTGSWQLTEDQVARLSEIAQGLNRAIEQNPAEVFLIEGHTDAVGSKEDNLSLSDRRAEAVAIALTEQFQVPPENLVTQGYGEEFPKVETDGAARENRFVAVRRITPLIGQARTEGSGSAR